MRYGNDICNFQTCNYSVYKKSIRVGMLQMNSFSILMLRFTMNQTFFIC